MCNTYVTSIGNSWIHMIHVGMSGKANAPVIADLSLLRVALSSSIRDISSTTTASKSVGYFSKSPLDLDPSRIVLIQVIISAELLQEIRDLTRTLARDNLLSKLPRRHVEPESPSRQ